MVSDLNMPKQGRNMEAGTKIETTEEHFFIHGARMFIKDVALLLDILWFPYSFVCSE